MSQAEIKISLESYKLAELAVNEEIDSESSNILLKESWVNLGNQLEIDGVPSEQISSVATKILIEKKAEKLKVPKEEIRMGGYFYRLYNERGWTNSFYARNTNKEQLESDQEGYTTVPSREQENSSRITFEEENKEWVNVIDSMIEFLKLEKSTLSKGHFNSKIPAVQSKQSITLMTRAIEKANERLNNKLKIAPSHYSILFEQSITALSSSLSTPYYEHVRKKETFTAKQAGKILKCIVKDIPYRYEPINEEEAEAMGFSGEPCPNCNNYRTAIDLRVEEREVEEDGELVKKPIGIRQLHCFKEDRLYDAPRPKAVMAEITESDW